MKLSRLIIRYPRQSAVLALLAVAGVFAGCSGQDYTSFTSTSTSQYDSFSYGAGVGVYEPWGYYGNPYYHGGGGVIVVAAPPRPVHYR